MRSAQSGLRPEQVGLRLAHVPRRYRAGLAACGGGVLAVGQDLGGRFRATPAVCYTTRRRWYASWYKLSPGCFSRKNKGLVVVWGFPPLSARFNTPRAFGCEGIGAARCGPRLMVALSAPRDARSKTPPGPEGSNGIDRRGRRGQPAGLPPFRFTLRCMGCRQATMLRAS